MEDANYESVYAYELDETVKEVAVEIRSVLNSIIGLLRSRGFEVQVPGLVNGRSGEKHMFDLVAEIGPERSLALDIFVADGYVPDRVVTLMFAKLYDTTFTDAFLVAMPGLSEEGRRLASLYRIKLIEGRTRDGVMSQFRSQARLVNIL